MSSCLGDNSTKENGATHDDLENRFDSTSTDQSFSFLSFPESNFRYSRISFSSMTRRTDLGDSFEGDYAARSKLFPLLWGLSGSENEGKGGERD